MTKKLLIVDDEPHIRLLLEQTLEELEDEGVELLSAENGEEALETIKEEKTKPGFFRCDDAQNEWV
jgi:two-component system alkaline phosphatase synthesis response regulator PhoP